MAGTQPGLDRARNGVEKPVYYRGEVVGSVRTYSDSLGMFLLRAKRPEVYDRVGGIAPPSAPRITEAEAKAEVLRRIELLRGSVVDSEFSHASDASEGEPEA